MTRLSFSSTASLYHAPLRPAWLSSPLPREHLGPFRSAFGRIGDLGIKQKLFPNSFFLQIVPSLLGCAPVTSCMAQAVLMLRRSHVEEETEARSTFLTPMRSDCVHGRAGNKYLQILPFYPTSSQHCFNNHLPARPESSRDPAAHWEPCLCQTEAPSRPPPSLPPNRKTQPQTQHTRMYGKTLMLLNSIACQNSSDGIKNKKK